MGRGVNDLDRAGATIALELLRRHINRTSCTPGQACRVFAVACATWWGLPWRTVDDDIWLIYPPAEPWAVLADRHGWPARTVTLHIEEQP